MWFLRTTEFLTVYGIDQIGYSTLRRNRVTPPPMGWYCVFRFNMIKYSHSRGSKNNVFSISQNAQVAHFVIRIKIFAKKWVVYVV